MKTPPARRDPAWVAALIGALFACWVYGFRVIDPASADWLLQGDAAQHYLGSVYFLGEAWHWPPGVITRFGDVATSVVFTDSIPLLALPAKLAGLDPSLQYFGLWMVACHALAGWFGVRLLARFNVYGAPALVGSVFFVMSPALLFRAYGHEALMAHWLVIAAIALSLDAWRWRAWLLLMVVAVLVHPYLAAMVGLLGCAAAASAVVERRVGWGALALQAITGLVVVWAIAWAAGYFVGSGQLSAPGHGYLSSNLLTWFDPMDWAAYNRHYGMGAPYSREWSKFMPALRQATLGQYEGFAYLGAGVLALVAIACATALATLRKVPVITSARADPVPRARWVFLLLACLAMALLAISARPSIGSYILADVPLPDSVQRALGVFRASGRFIWPLTYLLTAWAIARVARLPAPTWVLMLILVIVQAADLNGKFKELRARFREGPPLLAQAVTSPVWAALLARCPRLAMVSGAHPGEGWVGPALAAGLAKANFYPAPTARFSPEAEAKRVAAVQEGLLKNLWREGTVYLLVAPMPPGVNIDAVVGKLPGGMRHWRADGFDLVFDRGCLGR